MKQLLLLSAILIVFNGCKTIKVLESYNYTYYLLHNDKVKTTLSNETRYKNSNIYNNGIILLSIKKARYNYDYDYIKKQLDFIKEKDTMNIYCLCGQGSNYYLKNLKFKKGSYYVSFDYTNIKEVIGSQLNFSTTLQNILFEDYKKISPSSTPRQNVIREDVYFKNIKFRLIDFSDTTAVKLKPVSKEKFWSNNFLPKTN